MIDELNMNKIHRVVQQIPYSTVTTTVSSSSEADYALK